MPNRRTIHLAAAAGFLALSAAGHGHSARGAYGEKLGELEGVVAFSSGEHLGKTPEQGNQYQCTELIKRWMAAKSVAWVPVGLARNFFIRAAAGQIAGVRAYPNGSEELPRVGDIACFDDEGAGHLALISRVHPDRLELLEQNWHTEPNAFRSVSYVVKDRRVTIASRRGSRREFRVQGWVRVASGSQKVRVPADKAWVRTGLRLAKDQRVRITVTGTWTHGEEGGVGVVFYNADGYDKRDSAATLPSERIGTLIGRVGTGTPFRIGQSRVFTEPMVGELQLSINDVPGAFGNNRGEVVCEIETL